MLARLKVIKDTFCRAKPGNWGGVVKWVRTALDAQLVYFVAKMKDYSKTAVAHAKLPANKNVHALTITWRLLSESENIVERMPMFFKLAELAMTLVGTSVEDERIFSALKWLLDDRRNRLCGANLNNCLRIYDQSFVNEDSLTKAEILKEWLQVKNRRMVEK